MMNRLSSIAAASLAAALFAAPASAQNAYGSYGSYGTYSGDSCASGTDAGGYWGGSRTLQVVGLTSDNRLVCFNEYAPQDARSINFVSNLSGGDTALIGIDFRVQNRLLYGVGNAGGVYVIDTSNAVATLVNRLSVALDGSTSYGVDFNPAADRLRITSSKGQNLRHNVNAGGVTIVDGVLNYSPGVTALGIVGSAYTNNDLDANTATTLYALDSTLDQIALQSSPNNGTLAATGKLTLDATEVAGFDIYSTVRNGVTVEVQALASIKTADGSTGLYSVKLPTGKATSRGSFGAGFMVTDIAIPLNQL